MNPDKALERQLTRYREMTCDERIRMALGLHELASEMARARIRAQYPHATAAAIERFLAERRRLVLPA